MKGKRTVQFEYRGLKFSNAVRSPQEQLEMSLRCAVRGAGVLMGKLTALPGEAELAAGTGERVASLGAGMLRGAEASRKFLTELLAEEPAESLTGDVVMVLVGGKFNRNYDVSTLPQLLFS
eukprot:4695661-Amphidinium_carterae.1